MTEGLNFYTVIIGTELLNGRRADSHFAFANQLILQSGHQHVGNFVIKDDPKLIESTFEMILGDTQSALFSFGGIGATVDDLTREISAKVFTSEPLVAHEDAKALIVNQFKEDAYPYRIHMADLPRGAKLLPNVINNVAGYCLDNRYFFTPGFPAMAHPMVEYAFANIIKPIQPTIYRFVCVERSENDLIPLMEQIPQALNLSSLPKIAGERRTVVLSVSNKAENLVEVWYNFILSYLDERHIQYKKGEIC